MKSVQEVNQAIIDAIDKHDIDALRGMVMEQEQSTVKAIDTVPDASKDVLFITSLPMPQGHSQYCMGIAKHYCGATRKQWQATFEANDFKNPKTGKAYGISQFGLQKGKPDWSINPANAIKAVNFMQSVGMLTQEQATELKQEIKDSIEE